MCPMGLEARFDEDMPNGRVPTEHHAASDGDDSDGPPRTEPWPQEVLDILKQRGEKARKYLEQFPKLPCCIED